MLDTILLARNHPKVSKIFLLCIWEGRTRRARTLAAPNPPCPKGAPAARLAAVGWPQALAEPSQGHTLLASILAWCHAASLPPPPLPGAQLKMLATPPGVPGRDPPAPLPL